MNLWLDLAGAMAVAALAGAIVAAFISHRRGIYYALMTIAFCQIFWFVAVKWHSVTGGEDGLLNLKRVPADLGFVSIPLTDNVALYYFVLVVSVVVTAAVVAHRAFAVRSGDSGDTPERDARRFSATTSGSTSGSLSSSPRPSPGSPVRSSHMAQTRRVSRRHEPAFVRLRRHDDADRRRPGLVLGTAHRRRRLFRRPRRSRRTHVDVVLWYGLMFMAIVVAKPEGIAGMWQSAWRAAMFARPATCRRAASVAER